MKIKKVNVGILIFLGLLIDFASCTNENEADKSCEAKKEALIELENQQDSLVKSYFANQPNTMLKLKGNNFKLSLWEWIKVGLADAKGGIVAGIKKDNILSGAISASVEKWAEIVTEHITKDGKLDQDIKTIKSSNGIPIVNSSLEDLREVEAFCDDVFGDVSKVGYRHNKLILDLFDIRPTIAVLNELQKQQLATDITNLVSQEIGYDVNESWNNLQATIEQCNYVYSPQAKKIVKSPNVSGLYSDYDNVIITYLQGLANTNSKDVVREFSLRYVRNINASGLTNREKQDINTALSIAYASSVLWSKDYFEADF